MRTFTAMIEGIWEAAIDTKLYDVSSDPGELRNLADMQPEVTKELANKALTWYRSTSNK